MTADVRGTTRADVSAALGALKPNTLALLEGLSKGTRARITHAAHAQLCLIVEQPDRARPDERDGRSRTAFAGLPPRTRAHVAAHAVIARTARAYAPVHTAERAPAPAPAPASTRTTQAPLVSAWSVECRQCGESRPAHGPAPVAGICPTCVASRQRKRSDRTPAAH